MNSFNLKMLQDGKVNFDILVCEHCDLKCKGCNRFSNLSKAKFYPIENIKTDMLKLKGKIDFRNISVIGGEPLLYPDLVELLEFLRANWDCDIQIYTNGYKLLKMSDEFWKCCKHNNIIIRYSKYVKSKTDYDKIDQKAKEEEVKCFNSVEVGSGLNLDIDKFCFIKMSDNIGMSAYHRKLRCYCDNLPNLWQGKIYQCARTAFIDALNSKFNTTYDNSDSYIEVDKIKCFNDLKTFLLKVPTMCKNCCIMDSQHPFDWEQFSIEKSDFINE